MQNLSSGCAGVPFGGVVLVLRTNREHEYSSAVVRILLLFQLFSYHSASSKYSVATFPMSKAARTECTNVNIRDNEVHLCMRTEKHDQVATHRVKSESGFVELYKLILKKAYLWRGRISVFFTPEFRGVQLQEVVKVGGDC